MREPELDEFWWAWPPDGGNMEPVQVIGLRDTGNHLLRVLGRSETAYVHQWPLKSPIKYGGGAT